jgi:hypothetical protein
MTFPDRLRGKFSDYCRGPETVFAGLSTDYKRRLWLVTVLMPRCFLSKWALAHLQAHERCTATLSVRDKAGRADASPACRSTYAKPAA